MILSVQEEQRFSQLCAMAFDYARNDDSRNLKIMLDAGLNINLKTHKGDTLLMLAAYNNALNVAKMLLQMGANVDEKNDRGQTPLAGVCFKGHLDMVKLLVEYGANIDENNGLGMTPFSFAIMFGRKEVANYLIKHSKKSFLKTCSLKFLKLIKSAK
ncbi:MULTISPECIES: ankyrin repeat domain-containing protein [unclassified Campylobacter]|uniref:ankyrin repeat domain-containing protein n=1 Tax=unclassified Campylobacter TaxID=2593542 RepID=UPI001237E4AF|nr:MULTISPECIES: ankyrin repeat domain-containing protein [unclassified Campylobacter]KAA6224936.1 ankyrin repeat domain-containing protein [Campylobacter sp. LR286c]KAA6228399.1 ankyrin repeat domain-containing protein [Campylobacter sp. LR185c]KAA6228885.1 ankyrin repeat domain-containing protein [Campylobacter sp. LR196d]KAA6229839.1 ankyrin repeat domain-containing protein [Campylobacter sp. LR264d]KAA6234050.1 ankyrin repeat domain-containing protein [Campylobacter sp. LR291e]